LQPAPAADRAAEKVPTLIKISPGLDKLLRVMHTECLECAFRRVIVCIAFFKLHRPIRARPRATGRRSRADAGSAEHAAAPRVAVGRAQSVPAVAAVLRWLSFWL
jgi:hypothetical protein